MAQLYALFDRKAVEVYEEIPQWFRQTECHLSCKCAKNYMGKCLNYTPNVVNIRILFLQGMDLSY